MKGEVILPTLTEAELEAAYQHHEAQRKTASTEGDRRKADQAKRQMAIIALAKKGLEATV